MTLVGEPSSLNQLNAPPSCVSCWRIIDLEYGFGLPVLQDGTNNSEAGIFNRISTNANATVWYLYIRPGAEWSDGTPITSSDINFTFGLGSGYIMNTPRDFIGLRYEIKSIEILNSSEIQFNLNKTDSRFGLIMSSQYYFTPVPEHVWSGRDFAVDTNFAQDVTSGPFYHLNYTAGSDNITLVANPHYWDGPNLSEIYINFVSKESEAEYLLQQGKTDLAQVSWSSVSSFLGSPSSYGVVVEPDRALTYMEYNVSQYPFNETFFREGLAYAINTSEIAQEVYSGYATPGFEAEGLIPPSATLWHNTSALEYPYSEASAMNSFKSVPGLVSNSSGLFYSSNGARVSFKIYTDTNYTTDNETAQMVASFLRSAGMQISVVSAPLSVIAHNYTGNLQDIRRQIVIATTFTPLFGIGYLDVEPAYDLYYPWFWPQPNWMLPLSAEARYLLLLAKVNSNTSSLEVQQDVRAIDGLNSEFLPLIPLAYPDSVWVYYRGTSLSGFPSMPSTNGHEIDMGDYSLDPYTISQISCQSSACVSPPLYSNSTTSTTTTTSGTTSQSTSASSVSSSTGFPKTPPGFQIAYILAIIVVIGVLIGATLTLRRRRPREIPPPPSS
jgi:peptide/nickel transport system substrate-binding protein